jgi:autotransporter-associated beta strand protein
MPARRRPLARFRLQLDPLEDRLTPANLTWTGANSELWSDPGNWAQGVTPYMTPEPDALLFDEDPVRKVSNHDGPATSIESITFYDSGYTITGGDLTLDHYGIHSFVSYNRRGTNTVAVRTISTSEESLELNTTFAHEELVVRSNITGGRLLVNLDFQGLGDGTLTLLGNNSYTGGTSLHGGTLVVGNNSALGSGGLDFGDGTLEPSVFVTLPNPMSVSGSGCAIGGDNRLNFSGSVEIRGSGLLSIANTSGPVRFSGGLTGAAPAGITIEQNATLTVAAAPGVVNDYSGYIYGPGSLRKEGNGQLTLGGVDHYTGGTEIAAGVLVVTNDRALGGGAATLSGGTLAKGAGSAVTLSNPLVNTGGTIRNAGQFPFTFTGPGTLFPGLNRALIVVNTF